MEVESRVRSCQYTSVGMSNGVNKGGTSYLLNTVDEDKETFLKEEGV